MGVRPLCICQYGGGPATDTDTDADECTGAIPVSRGDVVSGDNSLPGTQDTWNNYGCFGWENAVPEIIYSFVGDGADGDGSYSLTVECVEPSLTGCADGSEDQVFTAGEMVGCAGVIEWPDRVALCAAGWTACS